MSLSISGNENQRVQWVDTLKYLGIFAIYLGHFGNEAGKFYPFVFIYHVPLFFFMSGFFADMKPDQSFFQFIKKKFQNIMVPYFIFVLLFEIMNFSKNNYNAHQTLNDLSPYLFAVRNTLSAPSLWFFSCLFLVELLHRVLLLLTKNKYLVLFITAIMILFLNVDVPRLFWNLDSAAVYLFYYALGNVVYPIINKYRFQNLTDKTKLLYILLVVGSALFTAMCYFKYPSYILPKTVYLVRFASNFYYALSACIIIFFNIQIAFFLEKIHYLQLIGRETLILCGTENLLKTGLEVFLSIFNISKIVSNPFAALLYTAVCLMLAYSISSVFKKLFPNILGKQKTRSLI